MSNRARILRARLALTLFLILGPMPVRAQADVSLTSRDTLEAFVAAPTPESWAKLLDDIKSGRYGALQVFLEFHRARQARDLPNSMTLEGIDPDQFVEIQHQKATTAIERLRTSSGDREWRLFESLMANSFDEELIFSASEVTVRIQPARFLDVSRRIEERRPASRWIFERVRERWLDASGHPR